MASYTLLILFQCGNSKTSQSDIANENVLPLTNSWEKAVPHQKIPEGLVSLRAEHCGSCHQQHYQEWQQSTHSQAWTDLQFQAELKKESSPFLCINCHIPLQNQQPYIIKGLIGGDIYKPVKEINPRYDEVLQKEGINCASCHVRNNVIIGLRESSDPPHRIVADPDFLSEKLCLSCHNANAVLTSELACTFETGDEWKASVYFGEKNCISCHMQETNREIVKGYGKRFSRLHHFPGSGIPKFDSLETRMLNGLAFYPSVIKSNYSVNDSLNFRFKVKNEFAGHRVPTGDPERFIIFSFQLSDIEGNLLAKKEERIGEQWEWYPAAKKLKDNNLNPLEERTFTFSYPLVNKGKFTYSVRVTKHRLNEENAKYNKLSENYPLFISIYEKDHLFEVN